MNLRALAPRVLYRNAAYLVAEMRVDEDAARRWLPAPLRLDSDVAELFTASFPSVSFGSVYLEAGLFLRVRHWGRRAIHCPWMVVDDDVALTLGRELLGYPKKMAALRWKEDGDRVQADVSRRGTLLVSMRASVGAPVRSPPPFLARPHRNLRGVALPWLVGFTPHEVPVEVRDAEIDVRVCGSERDPLHELKLQTLGRGRLHRVDIHRGGLPIPLGLASPFSGIRSTQRRFW
ncbi:MAG: acetoacetate decarboxylase family protein [Myxococcota bacterium]